MIIDFLYQIFFFFPKKKQSS